MTAQQKVEKVYDLTQPWGWCEDRRLFLLPRKKVLTMRNSVKALHASERGRVIPIRTDGFLPFAGSITVR